MCNVSSFLLEVNDSGAKSTLAAPLWGRFIKMVYCVADYVYKPNKLAVRIVVSSWWLFCIIIVATYISNLVAFLAVTRHTLPFTSLEELLANTDYKFGIQGGTAHIRMFGVSSW